MSDHKQKEKDFTAEDKRTKALDMLKEEKQKPSSNVTDIIRICAMLFFVFMIIADKMLHKFTPVLPEYYYGVSIGIMLFGEDIIEVWMKIRR